MKISIQIKSILIAFLFLSFSYCSYSQVIVDVVGSKPNFNPIQFVKNGDYTFFTGDDLTGHNQIWKMLNSTEAVSVVDKTSTNINPAYGISSLLSVGDYVYFIAVKGLPAENIQAAVYKLNITTNLISEITNAGKISDYFSKFLQIGDKLYYTYEDINGKNALGRIGISDDSFEKVNLVHRSLDDDPGCTNLCEFNGNLYFQAYSDIGEKHLYKLDVNTLVVSSLSDTNGSPDIADFSNTTGEFNPQNILVFNNKLYLTGWYGTSTFSYVLWEYDEISAAVPLFKDGSNFTENSVKSLIKSDKYLAFYSDSGLNIYDPQNQKLCKVELPTSYFADVLDVGSSSTLYMCLSGNNLFFKALFDNFTDPEERILGKYNITTKKFSILNLPAQGENSEDGPEYFYNKGENSVFFNAKDINSDKKLYKILVQTTWNGTQWDAGVPVAEKDAVIDANYLGQEGDITADLLQVNDGDSIKVNTGTFNLTINALVTHSTTPCISVAPGASLVCDKLNIPSITSVNSKDISYYSANIQAVANPNKSSCIGTIEFGSDTKYGNVISVDATLKGTVDITKSVGLYALKAGETYHYRLVLMTDTVIIYGADMQFTTLSSPTVDLSDVDIDVANKKLMNVTSEMEYSLDGTNFTTCANGTMTGINFVEGNVIVREIADPTNNKRKLAELVKPSDLTITFSIDYENLKTVQKIPSTVAYSTNNFAQAGTVGNNSTLTLTPGTDIYFRKPASKYGLGSSIIKLSVPSKPSIPVAFTIDYVLETTGQKVDATIIYATKEDFSDKKFGTGVAIPLIPGQKLWFKIPASNSNKTFESDAISLTIPARPEAPSFKIDFVNKKTVENVTSEVEYCLNETFKTDNFVGTGSKLDLSPGKNMWFRIKASNRTKGNGFSSTSFKLEVPQIPVSPTNLTVDDTVDSFDWTNAKGFVLLTDYEYSIDKGTTWTVCSAKPVLVGNVDIEAGNIMVKIVSSETHFSGDTLVSKNPFTKKEEVIVVPSNISSIDDNLVKIGPNPSNGSVYITDIFSFSENINIKVFDISGHKLFEENFSGDSFKADLSALKKGIYFISISTKEKTIRRKIVLQ